MSNHTITREQFTAAIEAGIARAGLSPAFNEKMREIAATAKSTAIGISAHDGHTCPLVKAGLWTDHLTAGQTRFYDAFDEYMVNNTDLPSNAWDAEIV